MIAKLKLWALAGLSIALAVVYALFNREKASRYKEQAQTARQATKLLTEANRAISDADKRGKERLNEKDPDRTHFQ